MKKISAFSLIELSIAVLIIGILIAGITQSTRIVKEARLRSARTLTQASPTAGISDLMLWYETSLETSFDSSEQSDGSTVSTWYDNNKQANVKNNATQSTSGYKPLFKTNIFNSGIPAVRFDGTDDYMSFDGSLLVGSNYTIFVAEQKRTTFASVNAFGSFIGGTTNATSQNLFFGYYIDTTMRLTHFGTTLSYTSSSDLAYSSPQTRIHSGRFSTSQGMNYYLNGSSKSSDSTATTALTSYTGSALGRRNGTSYTYFNGDLAEIIIFTRALSTEERQSIEAYLGKKYGVSISTS